MRRSTRCALRRMSAKHAWRVCTYRGRIGGAANGVIQTASANHNTSNVYASATNGATRSTAVRLRADESANPNGRLISWNKARAS